MPRRVQSTHEVMSCRPILRLHGALPMRMWKKIFLAVFALRGDICGHVLYVPVVQRGRQVCAPQLWLVHGAWLRCAIYMQSYGLKKLHDYTGRHSPRRALKGGLPRVRIFTIEGAVHAVHVGQNGGHNGRMDKVNIFCEGRQKNGGRPPVEDRPLCCGAAGHPRRDARPGSG